MCPRRYRLGKRQAEIEATRGAILRAARVIFEVTGFHRASVEDIARRADVAPATVYYQFGSKLGLLEAVLAGLAPSSVSGIEHGIGDSSEPARVLVELVRTTCCTWAGHRELLRALAGLGDVDPALRPTLDGYEQTRCQAMADFARRLHADGLLDPAYDERRAAAILSMLTSFSSYDHLVHRCGLSDKEAVETLTGFALALVSPADPRHLDRAGAPAAASA